MKSQHENTIKKIPFIIICVSFFAGCNESKESRIQKLEAEAKIATRRLQELERSVEKLESQTAFLKKD